MKNQTKIETLKREIKDADKYLRSAKIQEFCEKRKDFVKENLQELTGLMKKACLGTEKDYIDFYKFFGLNMNAIIDEHSSPRDGKISFSSY